MRDFDTGVVDFLNISNFTIKNISAQVGDPSKTLKKHDYEYQLDKQNKMEPGNLAALSIFFLLLIFLSMNGFDWLKRLKQKRLVHNCSKSKKSECNTRHGNIVGRIIETPEEEYERIATTAHRPEFLN